MPKLLTRWVTLAAFAVASNAAGGANYVNTQSVTGIIHTTSMPPIPAHAVTQQILSANRAGVIKLCFIYRVVGDDPRALERLVMKRVGDAGPLAEQVRKAAEKGFVLMPDGSFLEFYALANRYNVNAVRLCDDLIDGEQKGGPDANRMPSADAE